MLTLLETLWRAIVAKARFVRATWTIIASTRKPAGRWTYSSIDCRPIMTCAWWMPGGATLAQSVLSGTEDEQILHTFASSGDFYILVYAGTSDYDEDSNYRLIVDLRENSTCGETFEPNDSLSAASTMVLDVPNEGYICVPADEDWFATGMLAGGTLDITLSSLPADYDLFIYDANETELANSRNSGTSDEQISFTAPSDGAYYIAVKGYQGANSNVDSYVLQASRPPTSCGESFEVRMSQQIRRMRSQSLARRPLISATRWTRISSAFRYLWDHRLISGSGIFLPTMISRSTRSSGGSWQMSWSESRRTVARARKSLTVYFPDRNPQRLLYPGVWPERFRLRTRTIRLTLAAGAIPTATPDSCSEPFGFEPNESLAQAAAIQPNWAYAPLKLCTAAEEDWFKLDVQAGQRAEIVMNLLPANYDLAVYNSTSILLGDSAQSGTLEERVVIDSVANQTLYIRVHSSGGEFSRDRGYRLRSTIGSGPTPTPTPSANCGDTFEPNEDRSSASPIKRQYEPRRPYMPGRRRRLVLLQR